MLPKILRLLWLTVRLQVRRAGEQEPRRRCEHLLDEGRIRERIRMRTDRDVVALAYEVDKPVRCMRDDVDLRVPDEEARYDLADRELHGRHARRAAYGSGGFAQPMADRAFGQLAHAYRK